MLRACCGSLAAVAGSGVFRAVARIFLVGTGVFKNSLPQIDVDVLPEIQALGRKTNF
jgi:hypothetical protein